MFGIFEKNTASVPLTARLRPCCFGKMPVHADFIRHNLITREVGAFEKWLQEGVGCITRQHPKGWPPIYRDFPRHHFVMSGGDQKNNLLGSLTSSRDKSGRTYPFVTLTVAAAPLLHTNRATLPLVYREYFKGSDTLLNTAWENGTVVELTRDVDGLAMDNPLLQQRDLLERQIQLLSGIPMKDYWDRLRNRITADDREQFWCCFYNVIKTVLERGPARTHFGIRIPIPADNDQTPYVVFWVQMVESLLEDRFWSAHYFWNEGCDDNAACLTLFFRPLPPSYLLPLVNHELEDNAVFHIGREWPSLPTFKSRVDLRRLLEKDDIPMLEVLYRTGRREML
jgi:type VI secretion system protein ImpM